MNIIITAKGYKIGVEEAVSAARHPIPNVSTMQVDVLVNHFTGEYGSYIVYGKTHANLSDLANRLNVVDCGAKLATTRHFDRWHGGTDCISGPRDLAGGQGSQLSQEQLLAIIEEHLDN